MLRLLAGHILSERAKAIGFDEAVIFNMEDTRTVGRANTRGSNGIDPYSQSRRIHGLNQPLRR